MQGIDVLSMEREMARKFVRKVEEKNLNYFYNLLNNMHCCMRIVIDTVSAVIGIPPFGVNVLTRTVTEKT